MCLANSVSDSVRTRQVQALFDLWMESSFRVFFNSLMQQTSGAEFLLACLVREDRPLAAGELAARLGVSSARIARLLNSMQEKGTIRRTQAPDDRRKTLVVITEKGRARFAQHQGELESILKELIEQIGFEELCEFIRLSDRIGRTFIQCRQERGT